MNANKKYILSVVILLSYMLPGVISNMVSAQEVKHHIVYHDQSGSIIKRIPFTENYQFDEDIPPFFVELPYKNVAWNTKADGSGTSYTKSSTPLTSLSDDLNVYAKLEMGHFVRFDSREDAEGAKYTPGDDIIIKGNTTLTALYKDGQARIEIRRKGLKAGESAIYEIYKGEEAAGTPMMTVSITCKAGVTAEYFSRTISMLDPGKYTVKETSWSWAYSPDEEPAASPSEGSSHGTNSATGVVKHSQTTIFTFDGAAKDDKDLPKHAEGLKANEFNRQIAQMVDVQPYNEKPVIHVKY